MCENLHNYYQELDLRKPHHEGTEGFDLMIGV
jgi:hypothetical protein